MTCPTLVLRAGRAEPLLPIAELWRHRELLGFLAWRDIRVRYRQTVIGAGWALAEPIGSVLMFTLIFHGVAGFDAGGVPYPLYCLAAMIVWNFFARVLRAVTLSLTANAGLLTKTYFPRLILPLAASAACGLDLLCALGAHFALLAWYGRLPGAQLLLLPVCAVLAGGLALAGGLILATLNVRYRDVSAALPFLLQIGLLLSPVAYPRTAIPTDWQGLYALNPLVGVVELGRAALLPGSDVQPALLIPSVAWLAVLLLSGLAVFRAGQRRFADVV